MCFSTNNNNIFWFTNSLYYFCLFFNVKKYKMNKLYTISFIVLFSIISLILNAQTKVEKSDKSIIVFGKTYYLHTVEQGQTLYSISKAYGVKLADIYLANSDVARSGLKSGSTIKIPASGTNDVSYDVDTDDSYYVTHTVKPKQTIYYLSRKYNISEADLINLNPEIKNGLKVGQVIKIPKSGTIRHNNNDVNYHTVLPSETLFSLAQRYGVTISDIEAKNPDISTNGLRIGQVLEIPVYSKSYEEILKINHNNRNSTANYDYDPLYFESTDNTPCASFRYAANQKFDVAVLLPLFLQENQNFKDKEKYYKNTARFYEFYFGLLLAAKQMKKSGVSIEFHIKDTRASTQEVKSILMSEQMKGMDLIIGPIYSSNFKIAANFANKHKINIVAPFKLRENKSVVSNPYVFLTSPTLDIEVANISSVLAKSYDNSILMLHNGTIEESKIIQLFRKNLVIAFSPFQHINEIVFKNLNYKLSGASGLDNALSSGLYNIVVVPSNDQVFITNIVTKLNYLTKQYKIILYGLNAWERLRNIEIDYLRNLNFHYSTLSFVNNYDKKVKDFQLRYKTYFKDTPSTYSYMGYDISYYFLNLLKDYGKNFQFCLPTSKFKKYAKGLEYDFNFRRVSQFGGFENDWVRIVKVSNNLNLEKVR